MCLRRSIILPFRQTGHHPDLQTRPDQIPNGSKGGPEFSGSESEAAHFTDDTYLTFIHSEHAQYIAGVPPQKVRDLSNRDSCDLSVDVPYLCFYPLDSASTCSCSTETWGTLTLTSAECHDYPFTFQLPCDLEIEPNRWPNNSKDGLEPTTSESKAVQSTLVDTTKKDAQENADIFLKKVRDWSNQSRRSIRWQFSIFPSVRHILSQLQVWLLHKNLECVTSCVCRIS